MPGKWVDGARHSLSLCCVWYVAPELEPASPEQDTQGSDGGGPVLQVAGGRTGRWCGEQQGDTAPHWLVSPDTVGLLRLSSCPCPVLSSPPLPGLSSSLLTCQRHHLRSTTLKEVSKQPGSDMSQLSKVELALGSRLAGGK